MPAHTFSRKHDRRRLVDRRRGPDRRLCYRGGRRLTDRGGPVAPATCEDCSSKHLLQWVASTKDFDEFRCRTCGSSVFKSR
jgi:hypothetical protein